MDFLCIPNRCPYVFPYGFIERFFREIITFGSRAVNVNLRVNDLPRPRAFLTCIYELEKDWNGCRSFAARITTLRAHHNIRASSVEEAF